MYRQIMFILKGIKRISLSLNEDIAKNQLLAHIKKADFLFSLTNITPGYAIVVSPQNLIMQFGSAFLILFCSVLSMLLPISPNSFKFFRSPILSGNFVNPQPWRYKNSRLPHLAILSKLVSPALSDKSKSFNFFNSVNSNGITAIASTVSLMVVKSFKFFISFGILLILQQFLLSPQSQSIPLIAKCRSLVMRKTLSGILSLFNCRVEIL